ncbi:MAG: hypothetical protein CMK59_03505 [Proteobacteria bacterium]|nr:hypothetical protein [Pseudomonadota bacterium]
MSYGIYIHIPWCKRICPYCSFTVYRDKSPPFKDWLQKIEEDWAWNKTYLSGLPHSIYLGGGTPSLLPINILEDLIALLPKSNKTEITVEINPGDLTADLLASYIDLGITRLSLGIQTFQHQHARLLNRAHTVHEAEELVSMVAQSSIQSWSFDLIFGLPKQTLEDLNADLNAIKRLLPPHVSLYGLTYEPHTPLRKALERGQIKAIEEDLWIQQFDLITNTLAHLGYERYEVSNFALPGHRSIHNEHVWRGLPYCGLGPSAHGLLPNGWRTVQPKDLNTWFSSTKPSVEKPSKKQKFIDTVITQIRHIDGLSLKDLEHLGFKIQSKELLPFKLGWLTQENEHLKLQGDGWRMADTITLRLLDAFEQHRPH